MGRRKGSKTDGQGRDPSNMKRDYSVTVNVPGRHILVSRLRPSSRWRNCTSVGWVACSVFKILIKDLAHWPLHFFWRWYVLLVDAEAALAGYERGAGDEDTRRTPKAPIHLYVHPRLPILKPRTATSVYNWAPIANHTESCCALVSR